MIKLIVFIKGAVQCSILKLLASLEIEKEI